MKKTGLSLACLFALASAASAQTNLITLNPGFELGSPAGWYMWIDENSGGNALFETVVASHSGAYALQMTVKRSTPEIWQIQMNVPKFEAKANTRYRLTFWAKGPGSVKVTATDVAKNYAWMGSFDSNLGPDWTKVSGEFTTRDQAGSGAVGLGVAMGKQAGVYLLDDFDLEEVGSAAH